MDKIERIRELTAILDRAAYVYEQEDREIMSNHEYDALYDELDRLDPDGRRICELIMQGKTEREIAADMGRSQSTLSYQKRKVLSLMREALKDFI